MDDEQRMEACSIDDDESSGSGSTSDDDDCSPRIGNDFQVDELPRCTLDFFGSSNGSSFDLDDEEAAFATGGLSIPVTSIRITNERKQDLNRECDDQADEAEDRNNGGDRRRKGKKKRKGSWLTFRRMRAKSSLNDQMEEVIVPGDSFSPWEDCEEAAFLLGLYLFGKDFNALQRFLETRLVTDLQHYYYSVLYGTPPYKRWVAARNNCSKRIVNGQHILVGWRQEELLRRLLPELEESARPELFEAMAGFNKGDIPFEKYVSRIKEVAGLELFCDSVGLGCGKRDLTVGSVDAVQTSKKFELPHGKAFCDYTASEMFRAISGGCRLSKTKAQDLFWEAIWPRLLAKGWSSEQCGKGPLVYMVPGVKRYSKRSLIKGKDYFDSISEVLNYLSSDASLLEMPELDNELLAKSQKEANNKWSSKEEDANNVNGVISSPGSGERKRRPTLWLSKRSSHNFLRDEKDDQAEEEKDETPKEKVDTPKEMKKLDPKEKKKLDFGTTDQKKTEDPPTSFLALPKQLKDLEVNCRNDSSDSSSNPEHGKSCETTTGTNTTTTTATLVCSSAAHFDLKPPANSSCDSTRSSINEQVLSRWNSDFDQMILPPRKRSYYDMFSEGITALQLQGGVTAAVGFSAHPFTRKSFFLGGMIKHYLGSGKSVRLYGPAAKFSLQTRATHSSSAGVLLERFREEFIGLFVAVHWQRKMAKLAMDKNIETPKDESLSSRQELRLCEMPEPTPAKQSSSSIAPNSSTQLPSASRCCCIVVDNEETIDKDDGVERSCLQCASRVRAGGF